MSKVKIPTPKQLLDAGVHFGHQIKRWHPAMEKYIFAAKKGIHIIDLEKTEKALKETCEFLYETAANGGQIVFVGTKKQAREIIEIEAKRSGALFVSERWLGGTITNFGVIKKNLDKLVENIRKKEAGEFSHYTKKERLLIDREIEKLQSSVGGLVGLKSVPAALFIIDARKEKTAIKEAKSANVKVTALVDTNTDPRNIDYLVPGNDDAIKSIAIITKAVADAVEEGYKEYSKKLTKEEKTEKEELVSAQEQKAEEKTEETAKESIQMSANESPVSTEVAGKKLVEKLNTGEEEIVDLEDVKVFTPIAEEPEKDEEVEKKPLKLKKDKVNITKKESKK